MRVLTRAVLVLACLLIIPAAAYAQASIAGTVKEVEGSQATVTFTSPNPVVKPGMTAQVRIK